MAETRSDDGLAEALERWRSTLAEVHQEARAAPRALKRGLPAAKTRDGHKQIKRALKASIREGNRAVVALTRLAHDVDVLEQEWIATRRYEPDEMQATIKSIETGLATDPTAAARKWLVELFDGLDARERRAAALANVSFKANADLAAGAETIRKGATALPTGDPAAAHEALSALGDARLEGWKEVLTAELRARAHRLAAWVSLVLMHRADSAKHHVDQAVALYPHSGRTHAERSAFLLFEGELEQAAAEAQQAIEIAPEEPWGYLEFGIWAELRGEFDEADALYEQGLALMSPPQIARLYTSATLLEPPGRALLIAAEVLLRVERYEAALRVADQALRADVRGRERHPEVEAQRLRSLALEALSKPNMAAQAALEAGRLYVWNQKIGAAIDQFERAMELDPTARDAGWLLADALVTKSIPLGSKVPDLTLVGRARRTWDDWYDKREPPDRRSSWAYVTRAVIADLGTQDPSKADSVRNSGVWESILYIERALVLDENDGQRWGYAAQYLRYVSLERLAFEAARRGYQLAPRDRQVLAEHLPLLANCGRRRDLAEAEDIARRVVAMYGSDPWISAVRAWLAMHRGSFEKALRHLKLAIDKGNDPAWYHDMAALCHLAKGRVDEAKASYTRLLKEVEPIDGTMRCRLAMAATLTGDRKGARHWISAARQDPTTRSVDRYSAEALLAFASGKPDEGATLFAEAVRATRSEMALDDIVRDMKLREKAVPGDDQERAERREKLRQELDRVVAPHRHWITHHTPTGDSELEVKLEKDDPEIAGADLDVRTAALLAIRARRATAERPEQACQDYRRLRGSRFGPEAAIALGRVLERVGTQSARQGDTAAAEAIGHELAELRSEIPVTAALQASSVLEAAGRPTDAHRRLHVSEGEVSPTGVVRLGQRAAALAIAAGKPGEAEKDLRATVESARAESDHSRVAQTEVRLALTALASDDQARASAHMEEAIEAWRRAGALQPTAALLGELTGLAKRSTRWKALAERALEILGVDSSAGVAPVDIQGVADVAQKLARHTSQ